MNLCNHAGRSDRRRYGAKAWAALTVLGLIMGIGPAAAESAANQPSLRLSETVPAGSSLRQLAESNPALAAALAAFRAEAAAKGSVRVAVKTAVAFAPETLLTQPDVLAQRREIAAAAAALRKALPGARHFEALQDKPYVVLEVDAAGLSRLETHPGLVRISAGGEVQWARDFVQLRSSRFVDPSPARSDVSPRIIGGTDAGRDVHPFQVALLSKEQSNNLRAQFCGGVLVAPIYIVTAAHCVDFWSNPAKQVDVLVGTQQLDGSGRRVAVQRVFVHPGYNSKTADYDVAVVELAAPVTDIAFAKVADTQPNTAGTRLRTTGWGTRTPNVADTPVALQMADVPFVTTCSSLGSLRPITSRMICAGGEAGKSSCEGDSGGPLTINRGAGYTELVGIVSWGIKDCGAAGYPVAYANVAETSIRSFIQKIVFTSSGTIAFSAATQSVKEGERRVTLTLQRSSVESAARVSFGTANGTALNRADYRGTSSTVRFRKGQATATITISITNDRKKEGDETFTVTLSKPSNGWALGRTATTVVTITDND